MPLTRLTVDETEYTLQEALDASKAGTLGIPYPIVHSIVTSITTRQARDSGEGTVSVTDVVGCPRAKVLRATEEYSEDLDGLFYALRGQMLHHLIASNTEVSSETVTETRTSRDHKGYTLHGTADSITLTEDKNGRYQLVDYKSTKSIPRYGAWPNHKVQTNLYRWLYKLPADRTDISVIYFDLNNGQVAERKLKADDTWDDIVVEAFLDERFVPIAEGLKTGKLPAYRTVPAEVLSWQCNYCPVFNKCYDALLTEEGALPVFAGVQAERREKVAKKASKTKRVTTNGRKVALSAKNSNGTKKSSGKAEPKKPNGEASGTH